MAKNNKRAAEEMKEGLDSIPNNAPAAKFQETQQEAESAAANVDSGASSFVPKRSKAAGAELKQESVAKVIRDAQYGGSLSGDGSSFGGTRSSGGAGGVLGAANATPTAGKSRSDSRTSKKLDRNSTKLNYIPNETIITEWDESKPLADAADADQGFNGTYRNEYARSQKKAEAVPGGLMFDRSVDLITKDNLYFGQGQYIAQSGVVADEQPTRKAEPNVYGVVGYPASDNYSAGAPGDFILDSLEAAITPEGDLAYVHFIETDATPSVVDQFEANKSSAQALTLRNDAELVRESMDSKAGDEKADVWTPLARAIDKPTQVVGLLRDIEAETGNEVFTAYRKASSSMSYQMNRAHKDGQDVIQPALEALFGFNANYVSKSAAATALGSSMSDAFKMSAYRAGEASTMIALYDSIAKYSSKADLLLQPRAFRMHLQTADNNMDPLHVAKLFCQAYDASETFSTIGREYDPMMPVCMTDKAAVVHRHSWHKMGSFVQSHIKYTVDTAHASKAAPSVVLVPAALVNEVKSHGLNAYVVYAHEASGDMTFNSNVISPDSSYEFANSANFELFFGSSAPAYDSSTHELLTVTNGNLVADTAITYNPKSDNSHYYNLITVQVPNDSKPIYCYQGGPYAYCYSDLRNSYVVTVKHPLLQGICDYFKESIGGKYYSLLNGSAGANNTYAPIKVNTYHSTQFFSLWSFLLCAATPWIVKARINSMRDVLYYEKNIEYPFSSTLLPIRDVSTKDYSNFHYSDYDSELEVGVMKPAAALNWTFPELFQQVGYSSGTAQVLMPWYTNQNAVRYRGGAYSWDDDASAMSIPSIRSGVRLAALDAIYGMDERDVRLAVDCISSFKSLSPTLGSSKTYKYSAMGDGQLVLAVDPAVMTALTLVKLPREVGFVVTAPYGTLTPTYAGSRSWSTSILGASSFVTKYWLGKNATTTGDGGTETILATVTVNVDRAQNFVQDWFAVLASGTIPPIDHGFVLSANQAYSQTGSLLAGRSSFHPYTNLSDEGNGVNSSNMNTMRSLQKIMWTRLQKLPFAISPFDGLAIDNTATPNSVVLADPYDLLYFFGLGGFRASDFRESVYNREKRVVNQGILFVSDPWVEYSPIFREGAISSGISVTRGFEL